MVPPPASTIKTCSPRCERIDKPALGGEGTVTNLQVPTRLGMGDAEVETCFAFGHKMDSGIGDNTRSGNGGSQLRLLLATPSVGMAQHQFDIVRDAVPSAFPIRLGGLEQRLGRIKEITHEVSVDVDDGFSPWEARGHLILHRCGRLCG